MILSSTLKNRWYSSSALTVRVGASTFNHPIRVICEQQERSRSLDKYMPNFASRIACVWLNLTLASVSLLVQFRKLKFSKISWYNAVYLWKVYFLCVAIRFQYIRTNPLTFKHKISFQNDEAKYWIVNADAGFGIIPSSHLSAELLHYSGRFY